MNFYQLAKNLAHTYSFFPKKRLGQNFMVDAHFLQLMTSYALLNPSDIVLEVGAGLGFLTRLLAERSRKVFAVEADARLIRLLRNELSDINNLELIEGNILKVTVPAFNKIVSNPPFSISSPLLFWLINKHFDCAVLTFQKEFAKRLSASPGSKDYSRLTVSTFYRAEAEILDPVPAEAFYPSPKVDASIVRLKRKNPPFELKDERAFDEVVRTLFTQRNKKVRNSIQPLLRKYGLEGTDIKQKMRAYAHLCDKRVRELTAKDFGALTHELLSQRDHDWKM